MKRSYSTLATVTRKPLKPLNDKLLAVLDTCTSIDQIKQTHAKMITTGFIKHPIPATKLIQLLTLPNLGFLSYAHQVFDQIPSPDLFTYNSIIKAHASSPHSSHNALLIFRSMLRYLALLPNQYTLVFIFKASSCVSECEQVLTLTIKLGFESNLFVANKMIKMYSGWGLIDVARRVFDRIPDPDLYSWNSMISGYVGSDDMDKATELFDEMPERDVVSWSAVIAGYVQVGCFIESIELFREMLVRGPEPNAYTLVSALSACANLAALHQGRWIHAYIHKAKIKMNEQLLASLIDMYSKCGEIEFASEVFYHENSLRQTIFPWNALLGGFAMNGCSTEAVDLFENMILTNITPNKVTFISLLNACSHGNLVEEGRKYFKSMMSSYGVEPEIEHYGCMVDLLGRSGLLKEAEEIILTMPVPPDTIIWGALLGACRKHKDTEKGERVGNIIRELDPKNVGCNVLLANMYSSSGRWNEAKVIRDEIVINGEKKTPGCTSIEINGIFHQFLVGDRSHTQTKQIYSFLDEMMTRLKIAGYVPEVGEVLLDINDEEDKETALSIHSEKLAIAFGLINTAQGTSIRIVKNLRVCGDCHQATKLISKVYDREIIVRDRLRFHHFRNGVCSCKDYW